MKRFHVPSFVLFTLRWVAVPLFLCLLVWWLYYPTRFIYYLNDEWTSLGHVMKYGIFSHISSYPVWQLAIGKGRVAGTLLSNVLLARSLFDPIGISYVTMTVHAVNSVCVYILLLIMTRAFIPSLAAASMLAISMRAGQTMTWLATGPQTTASMFFLIMSTALLLYFVHFRRWSVWVVSFLVGYVSFLVKENTVFHLLIILGVGLWRCGGIRQIMRMMHTTGARIVGVIAVMSIVGVSFWYLPGTFANANGMSVVRAYLHAVINVVYYPLVSLGSFVIPSTVMKRFAATITQGLLGHYETTSPVIQAFIIPDSILLSVGALIVASLWYSYMRVPKIRLIILGAITWYVLSFVPIAFHLILRYESYIESEYLYYQLPVVGLLLGCVLQAVLSVRFITRSLFAKAAILGLCFLFGYMMIQESRNMVTTLTTLGIQMRATAVQFRLMKDQIPADPIMFISSPSEFWFSGNRAPFWLGTGYVVAVILFDTGRIPGIIIDKRMYGEFGEQGYIRANNIGYGYYWDADRLARDWADHPEWKEEQLVGYMWNPQTTRFDLVTDELRSYIRMKRNEH